MEVAVEEELVKFKQDSCGAGQGSAAVVGGAAGTSSAPDGATYAPAQADDSRRLRGTDVLAGVEAGPLETPSPALSSR